MLIQLLRSVRVTLPSVATCPGDSSAATSSGNTASSTMMSSSTMTGSSMSSTRTADTVADAVTGECRSFSFPNPPCCQGNEDQTDLRYIGLTMSSKRLNRWIRQQPTRSHHQQLQHQRQVLANSLWLVDSVRVLLCLELRSYNAVLGVTLVVKEDL